MLKERKLDLTNIGQEITTLENRFASKIKTPEELVGIIGSRPRKDNVIICHGTFDNLHVGHLRQLIFAKNKAPVLVVSLTCDQHIAKGSLRPWVPQELRALHLAALEFVDYVVIDQNPTPIENIHKSFRKCKSTLSFFIDNSCFVLAFYHDRKNRNSSKHY